MAARQDQCAGHQRQSLPEVLSVWPQGPLLPHLPTGVCGQLDRERLPGDSPAGEWRALREPALGLRALNEGCVGEPTGWGGPAKSPAPGTPVFRIRCDTAAVPALGPRALSEGHTLSTCCLVLSRWRSS